MVNWSDSHGHFNSSSAHDAHTNTYNVNVKGSSAFKTTRQASAPHPVAAIPEVQNQVRSLTIGVLNSCRFSEMWNECARDSAIGKK